MSGLVVFTSLREALNAGYHIYGRTERGYLARLRTDGGWALALVECAAGSSLGTNARMERDETQGQRDEKKPEHVKESEDARKGDRKLEDYDKTVADSFPASDPPAQP
jgi:hypothetical protein